jgi:glucose-6-phosphate isomerase
MNPSLDLSQARSFLDPSALDQAQARVQAAFSDLRSGTGKGSEWLGWRRILATPDDALLNRIGSLAAEIRNDADVFIVCGIGGSYLGARAVIEALGPFFGSKGPEIVYAGHHMSGRYLNELVRHLEGKRVWMNVISKSGTTMETALAFRVLRQWMVKTYGESEAASRIIATTSESGGALNRVIAAKGYRKFVLPDDVGGRFSVLTPVGLLPIAVAGIDVRDLFYGGVSAYRASESGDSEVVRYAAARLALYEQGRKIDILATFEPNLNAIGGWMQQLFGESEGKDGKGLYPAVHGYSTDLHSLGQMVQDGERNLMETFLEVAEDKDPLVLHADPSDFDGLNYLAGRTMHHVNSIALQGTREAHVAGRVPVLTIRMIRLDATTLGGLIYFLELATALYGYALGVNPFDQPGVEDYKKAMYRLLGNA